MGIDDICRYCISKVQIIDNKKDCILFTGFTEDIPQYIIDMYIVNSIQSHNNIIRVYVER